MLKVLTVVGARPNLVKAAALAKEMQRHSEIRSSLIHTGQHYDPGLSNLFFEDLELPRPEVNLGVGSAGRDEQILAIIRKLEPEIANRSPDLIVVVGDVNSTLAGARAAKGLAVSLAHVEAGLRSFDDRMPEERNRVETDALSDFLFVTEESGLVNLAAEEVHGEVHLVGNVMIDTLVANLPKADRSNILSKLGLAPREYIVATLHRPDNVDSKERLMRVAAMLRDACSTTKVVFPVHPRTWRSLDRHGILPQLRVLKRLILCAPLGYLDFLKLLKESAAAVTDSGGIQEETTFLRVPCLTMRDSTERPVTVTLGSNTLVGSDPERVIPALKTLRRGQNGHGPIPPLWDGRAARRIVEILKARLGVGPA